MILPQSLFALFFLQLSLGMMISLTLLREVGRGFQRFNTGLILLFMLLICGFGLQAGGAGPQRWAAYGLIAFVVTLILYQASLWGPSKEPSRLMLGLAVVGAIVAASSYFWIFVPSGMSTWQVGYCLASLFATAATLGTVMGAMLLGHWYLVRFDLPIEPFKRMTTLLLAALLVRALLSAASIPLFVPGETELGRSAAVAFAYDHLLFLLPRYLVGIVFPLGFAWMAHQTVKIHSKQSATGILYVTIVPIIMGELMADFLYLATKVPV